MVHCSCPSYYSCGQQHNDIVTSGWGWPDPSAPRGDTRHAPAPPGPRALLLLPRRAGYYTFLRCLGENKAFPGRARGWRGSGQFNVIRCHRRAWWPTDASAVCDACVAVPGPRNGRADRPPQLNRPQNIALPPCPHSAQSASCNLQDCALELAGPQPFALGSSTRSCGQRGAQ